jgi:hypothetical protein
MACGSLPGLKDVEAWWRPAVPPCCGSAPFLRLRFLWGLLPPAGCGLRSGSGCCGGAGLPRVVTCNPSNASCCSRFTADVFAVLPPGTAASACLRRGLEVAPAVSVTSGASREIAAAAKRGCCSRRWLPSSRKDAGSGGCIIGGTIARPRGCGHLKSHSDIKCVIRLACRLLVMLPVMPASDASLHMPPNVATSRADLQKAGSMPPVRALRRFSHCHDIVTIPGSLRCQKVMSTLAGLQLCITRKPHCKSADSNVPPPQTAHKMRELPLRCSVMTVASEATAASI